MVKLYLACLRHKLHIPPSSFDPPSSYTLENPVAMPLFKKKPPPVWFVLRPPKGSSSNSDPKREGPYTRTTIAQMHAEGMLGDGALLWTNEKIFPNAEKPNSFRPVRIMEWRRLDQLPDPVVRQLDAEWQQTQQQQNAPNSQPVEGVEQPSLSPDSSHIPSNVPPPSHGAPPPFTGGTPTTLSHHQQAQPTPSSIYPAGATIHQNPSTAQDTDQSPSPTSSLPTFPPPPPQNYSGHNPPGAHNTQPSGPHPQMGAIQPGVYPASAAYPPPAPGAY